VQTPTLSVVVEREEKIRKFVSRDYWEIHGVFQAEAGQYPGKWFDANFKKPPAGPDGATDAEIRADRVWSEREAREIADAARGKPATVTEESKPTTQASPMLFDLTSLQREANGRFGFSAKTTLALAQSLYERHKALTGGEGHDEDARHQRHEASGALRAAGGRRQLREAEQAHLRQRQGIGSLRHHSDPAGAERPFGCRAEAVRLRGAPLHVGVRPER
jgi:hypothetical protein